MFRGKGLTTAYINGEGGKKKGNFPWRGVNERSRAAEESLRSPSSKGL